MSLPRPEDFSPEPEFDWLQLRKDLDTSPIETPKEKLYRKFNENPLVPIGSLATVGALGYGLWCFRLGRSQMSQYMMRARVVAQGFTLVALLIGVSINATQGPKDDKK